jgi:hypothetical protein
MPERPSSSLVIRRAYFLLLNSLISFRETQLGPKRAVSVLSQTRVYLNETRY